MPTVVSPPRWMVDANVLIPNLLTHNVADFARYSGLITVIPLVS